MEKKEGLFRKEAINVGGRKNTYACKKSYQFFM